MRLCRFLCSAGVCLLVAVAVPGQSFAQAPSGTAVAVVQLVSAVGPGGSRVLQAQQPVFTGDRVNTGPVGEAQIRFRDQTRLVVGPNSSLTIDRFVFAADGTAQQVVLNAAKGAFRFFSGVSPSQAYSFRTPTATIGVRGTRFDLVVLPGKRTSPDNRSATRAASHATSRLDRASSAASLSSLRSGVSSRSKPAARSSRLVKG
jgi:hypothetical protein